MSDPELVRLLDGVRKHYRSCSSYRDQGEVRTTHRGNRLRGHCHTRVRVFRTVFRRPNALLFEFRQKTVGPESEWPRFVVWGSGSRFQSWWTLRPDEVGEHESLHHAIAGPTGISGGSAYRVPTLLVAGGEGAFPLPAPVQAEKLEDASLDDLPCHRVRDLRDGWTGEVWISREDLLVHRVDGRGSVEESLVEDALARLRDDPSLSERDREMLAKTTELRASSPRQRGVTSWESTTTYHPSVDVEVADEELVFEPPVP